MICTTQKSGVILILSIVKSTRDDMYLSPNDKFDSYFKRRSECYRKLSDDFVSDGGDTYICGCTILISPATKVFTSVTVSPER